MNRTRPIRTPVAMQRTVTPRATTTTVRGAPPVAAPPTGRLPTAPPARGGMNESGGSAKMNQQIGRKRRAY